MFHQYSFYAIPVFSFCFREEQVRCLSTPSSSPALWICICNHPVLVILKWKVYFDTSAMSHPPFSLLPSWLNWAWIPWNRRVGTGAKSVVLLQSLWQQIAAFAVSSLITRALTSEAGKHWNHQGCCLDVINNILESLNLVESSKAAKFSWEYLELLYDGAQKEEPVLCWSTQLVQYGSTKSQCGIHGAGITG